jgi:hypothetical protein
MRKKILVVLTVLTLIVLVATISYTYAKYITVSRTTMESKIARWNIKVNDEIIKNNTSLAYAIEPTFFSNENIAEGVIAPSSEGYFDIKIDYTNVDVSFTYEINIADSTDTNNTAVPDYQIIGYKIFDGVANASSNNNGYTAITTNSVSDSIPYDATATNRIKTIRVYTKWVEGTGESMNNDDDTDASSDSSSSYKHNIMNVTMKFTQTI